jgi:hypothetical protein
MVIAVVFGKLVTMHNLPVFELVFKTFSYLVYANAGTCTAERFWQTLEALSFKVSKKRYLMW